MRSPVRNVWVWVLAFGLIFGIASVGAPKAVAFTSWSPAANLSVTGANGTAAQVAVTPDGKTAVAIWRRGSVIQAATGTLSGSTFTWAPASDISGSGNLNPYDQDHQLSMSPDGKAVIAAWTRNSTIEYATASITSGVVTWATGASMFNLAANGMAEAYKTHVSLSSSVSGTHTVVAAFDAYTMSGGYKSYAYVLVGTISANVTSWGTPSTLGATTTAGYPQIALSENGTMMTATWEDNSVLRAVSATISGQTPTWGTAALLSNPGTDTQLALSSDGTRALAVWRKSSDGNRLHGATALITGNSGSWESDSKIDNAPIEYFSLGLSANGSTAVVVWDSSSKALESRTATFSGSSTTWSGPQTLQPARAAGAHPIPQVSLAEDGSSAAVIWRGWDGSNDRVQTASAAITSTTPGGTATWETPVTLSAAGKNAGGAYVALKSDGSLAVAVWDRNDGTNSIVQSAYAPFTAVRVESVNRQDLTHTGSRTITAGTSWTPAVSRTPSCTGTLTYSLSPDPFNRAASNFTFGSAPIETAGWQAGTYDVRIDAPATSDCTAASTSFVLTVTSTATVKLPNTGADAGLLGLGVSLTLCGLAMTATVRSRRR